MYYPFVSCSSKFATRAIVILLLIFAAEFGISQIVNLPCQTEIDGFIGLDRKAWAGIGNTTNHSQGSLHNFDLPADIYGPCKRISNVTINLTVNNVDISNLPSDCPPPSSYYVNIATGCASTTPASCPIPNFIYEAPHIPLVNLSLSFNDPPENFFFGDNLSFDIVPVMNTACSVGQSAISSGGIVLDFEICVIVTIVDDDIVSGPELGATQTICPENTITLNPGSFSSYVWGPNGETTPTINAGPGLYTVTVTDANGCTGSDDIIILGFPQSNITFDPIVPTVCDNGSIMVSVNESYNSYNWSNSMSGQTIALTPGSYMVTITDGNSCTSIGSIDVNNVNPPNAGTDNNLEACNDGILYNIDQLLFAHDAGGTWTDNNGSGVDVNINPNAVDFTGVVPGSYSYTYTVNGISPCPPDQATITVDVYDQNYAGIDNAVDFCIDPGAINFLNLLGNPDVGGFWTEVTPLGLDLTNPTAVLLDGIPTGSYQFSYTISQSGPCPLESSVLTINIVEGAIAGFDNITTVCEGATIDLNLLISGANQAGIFEDTDGSGALVGSMVFTAGLAGQSFDFTYVVGSSSSICGEDEAIFTIIVENSLNAGDDISNSFCVGGDINLLDLLPNEDLGGIFSDVNTSGGLTGNILTTDNILPGTYDYEYTIGDGITCPIDISIVTITFLASPSFTLSIDEVFICENSCEEVQINLSGTPPYAFPIEVYSATTGNLIASNNINSNDNDFTITVCSAIDTSIFTNDTLQLVSDSSWYVLIPDLNDLNCAVDAAVILDTLFLNTVTYSRTNIDTTSCISDTLTIGSIDFFFGNGTYQDTIPGVICDSIININVTFTDIDTVMIQPIICSGDSIFLEGIWFDENMDFQEVSINNPNGCDSLKLISVSFYPASDTLLDLTLCEGDSLIVNNTVYNVSNPSGFEILQGASRNGCDSTIQVSLQFSSDISVLINDQLCIGESIIVGSDIYDIDNPQGQTILSGSGCDTVVDVNLSFYGPATGGVFGMFCSDYFILINGNTYDASNPSGSEIIANGSSSGCDSMVTIDLDFFALSSADIELPLCEGEFIIINGTTYDASNTSGTEILSNASSNGCDSTVNIQVAIYQSFDINNAVSICEGDSVYLSGAWQFVAGTYVDNLQTENDCDSVITTQLSVLACSVIVQVSSSNNACARGSAGGISLDIQSEIQSPFTVIWNGATSGTSGQQVFNTFQNIVNINGLISDTYSITIVDAGGIEIYQNTTVIIDENPPLGGMWTLIDTINCNDETGAIEFVTSGGTAPYNFNWEPNSLGNTPIVQNVVSGDYALTITDQLGCTFNTIFTLTEPAPISATIMTSDISCEANSDGNISISNIEGGTAPYEILLNGEIQTSSMASNLDPGEYIIEIVDAKGCTVSFNTQLIVEQNAIFGNFTEEYVINQGDSVTLNGTVSSGIFLFEWEDPNASLSCTNCQNPIANPSESTMYVLTITDEFGCTQQILVTVDVLIERIVNVFPNVFSPNGDNNNDLFIFRPIQGTVMAISLDIYDRWGNLMHSDQVTGEEITWEGTTNGQELVPGVYIYKATILYSDNRSETVVSDLLILR